MNLEDLDYKKQQLDTYRPMSQALLHNLESWFNIELTYTSNAIEGNTLTRQETVVVLEKGITIGGKTLKEHLEVINHEQALSFIKTLVDKNGITESELLHIHAIILGGIDNANAGRYRDIAVRIAGSSTILPNPLKIPYLMTKFFKEIFDSTYHPVTKAARAHYELVTIHPFIDGNGRSARLLMNLILIQNGYPPAIVRTQDRLRYLKLLELSQTGGPIEPFLTFIYLCVNRSLDIYLGALNSQTVGMSFVNKATNLYRIGELAKKTNESVATIRFWTKLGILKPAGTTDVGYTIYSDDSINVVKQIRQLQLSNKSLEEIQAIIK